jgi:uncharacterized damage-inducible protein DinB
MFLEIENHSEFGSIIAVLHHMYHTYDMFLEAHGFVGRQIHPERQVLTKRKAVTTNFYWSIAA